MVHLALVKGSHHIATISLPVTGILRSNGISISGIPLRIYQKSLRSRQCIDCNEIRKNDDNDRSQNHISSKDHSGQRLALPTFIFERSIDVNARDFRSQFVLAASTIGQTSGADFGLAMVSSCRMWAYYSSARDKTDSTSER